MEREARSAKASQEVLHEREDLTSSNRFATKPPLKLCWRLELTCTRTRHPKSDFLSAKVSNKNMGAHDKYGKDVMTSAFGDDFNPKPESVYITHGGQKAGSFTIDGILFGDISVEIESRVNKQVRGALLDLILHPGKLKLLVLIAAHGNDYTELQAKSILTRFCVPGSWRVVALQGSGDRPAAFITSDKQVLQSAANELMAELS